MAARIQMEIITPSELFYSGEIESLVVKTTEGEEGFLAGHSWCIKLLPEDGKVRIIDSAGATRTALVKSGYVDIKDKFVVFSDEARWVE